MRLAVSLLMLLLFSACIPERCIRRAPFYVQNKPFNKEEPVESIRDDYRDTKIAYVELDDMGDLWDDMQILKAVETVENANQQAAAVDSGAIVFTYVHGWHQNSDTSKKTKASNLEMFKRILGWTAYEEIVNAQGKRQPRPVVGVYIGWRGITGYWPLDYYNRHKAAGRVAGSSATEALLRVTTAARKNLKTRSIVIGHSMGGLIVERALVPVLDSYLLKITRTKPRTECQIEQARESLPADLILLINPASHAIEAKKFIGTLSRLQVERKPPETKSKNEEYYKFFSDRKAWPLPLIVSLTSEGDSSTRVTLNLAAYPMLLNKSTRAYDAFAPGGNVLRQRDLLLHTAGNFSPFASHWVRHEELNATGQVEVRTCSDGLMDGWMSDRSSHLPEDQIPQGMSYPTLCFESSDSQGGDRFWILQKPPSLNTVQRQDVSKPSPYWIMHIPTTVVKDHARIFRFELVRLVRGLLRISGATGTVPADCKASNPEVQGTSLNPNAMETLVSEPLPCVPPPPLRLAAKGFESGCDALNPEGLCFEGERFSFHLYEEGKGKDVPYEAGECEAIQWNFADGSPLEYGNSVEHLLPIDFKQAAIKVKGSVVNQWSQAVVEVKSSVANQWIPIRLTPKFAPRIVPAPSYRGERSKCSSGEPCWVGETIRFEVVAPQDVEATWTFDGVSKKGTPIEHTFTTPGTRTVHLGIATKTEERRGGATTVTIPVETHCTPPGDGIAIHYSGERSSCIPGGADCMAGEEISFSLVRLPAEADESCFKVEWSFGDGFEERGLSTSHLYKTTEPVTVSANVISSGSTVTASARLNLICPPPKAVSLEFSGRESGCSRATVSNGTRLCRLNEPIEFSATQAGDGVNCSETQWSFLKPGASALRTVRYTFRQPVPSVSVKMRSAGEEVSDSALILFECEGEGCEPPDPACPPIGEIGISYVGDDNCTRNKKCAPGETITFSIVPSEGLQRSCPGDKILWLFDDGSEPQEGPTAKQAFGRSRPPHAVHLIVLRNGKVSMASTTVDVPLLPCRSCSGER